MDADSMLLPPSGALEKQSNATMSQIVGMIRLSFVGSIETSLSIDLIYFIQVLDVATHVPESVLAHTAAEV
jgi:hypothetical protein